MREATNYPTDWALRQVGDLGDVQLGRQRSPATDSGVYMTPYLRVANVYDGWIDHSDILEMNFSPVERDKFFVRKGDILLNEGQSLELVGRCALYDGPEDKYCFQNTLVRFRHGPLLDPRFTRAVFKRWLDIGRFMTIAKQTTSMAHLGADRFARLEMPLPSLAEQRRIAEILDTVDEAIRKTEQIIAKLKQVKQGLLHDLLTRGIDENGELRDPERHPEQFKDSLLGRLPKAWDVVRLGTLLSAIDAGKSPSCPDIPAAAGQWGVLKVSAVRPEGFQPLENKAVLQENFANPTFEVRDGDLLMTRANTPELVGYTCLVEAPPARLMLSDKTLRLHVNNEDDTQFVFFVSQMPFVRRQIETHATGSSGSMKNIGQHAIRSLLVPRPTLNEQRRIAERLRGHELRLKAEAAAAEKLRLLKSGLMEDLLTGRVRTTDLEPPR